MEFSKHFYIAKMGALHISINNHLDSFYITGVNYQKSDISMRSKFSLSESQTVLFLKEARANGFSECFVLSTCNRTEVYSNNADAENLIQMLCRFTHNSTDDFFKHGYIYQGISAMEHLLKVASGLDSQIIGDYEILGQLKQAAKIAKQNGCINNLMERIINYSFQASKEIKTKTKLSSGILSVSYAAIEIIKQKITNISDKKFLLVGTGKFGKNIAKNLKSYLPGSMISFTNRTDEKASELANQYEAVFIPYKNLPEACNDADIIIVSSAAEFYTILPSFFTSEKSHLILDLSIPQNVDPAVKNIGGISMLNLDEVSPILDKTISVRLAEVPEALKIISKTLEEMINWCLNQNNNSLLRQVKAQLYELSEIYFIDNSNEEKIHQAVSSLATKLKYTTNKGCECINALHCFLQSIPVYNSRAEHFV